MQYHCTIHGEWDANRASGCPDCMAEARRYIAQLNAASAGARDMLREAAKQFRLLGDDGHAVMCDIHADAMTPNGSGKPTTEAVKPL